MSKLDEELAVGAREMLEGATALIDKHGYGEVRLRPHELEFAVRTQNAARRYLWEIGAPEAEEWWGRSGMPVGKFIASDDPSYDDKMRKLGVPPDPS